jgi:hypothetical protein
VHDSTLPEKLRRTVRDWDIAIVKAQPSEHGSSRQAEAADVEDESSVEARLLTYRSSAIEETSAEQRETLLLAHVSMGIADSISRSVPPLDAASCDKSLGPYSGVHTSDEAKSSGSSSVYPSLVS